MKIITVPHKTLRQTAKHVEHVDKKVLQFIGELQDTLAKKDHPKGVGLAAPQVNTLWQVFVTQLPIVEDGEATELKTYINPVILEASPNLSFGPDKRRPVLEGCLSIPGIYGPVPRHSWIWLEYQVVTGDQLETRQERMTDYAARVVQHEVDHLHGKLFIDYALEYEIPLYKEDPKTEKLIEIEPELIPALVARTQ